MADKVAVQIRDKPLYAEADLEGAPPGVSAWGKRILREREVALAEFKAAENRLQQQLEHIAKEMAHVRESLALKGGKK